MTKYYYQQISLTFLFFLGLFTFHPSLFAQTPETTRLPIAHLAWIDTISVTPSKTRNPDSAVNENDYFPTGVGIQAIDESTKKKRLIFNIGLHTGTYAGSMLALNQAWYAGFPRSSFHSFNDNKEWLQVDKVGHTWTAYQISRASMATWKWAGLNSRRQIWAGGLAGATFQTVIEVLDGFSTEWGWSWGDFAANCVGSGLLIGQQLAWNQQRVSFKFSFHQMNYGDAMLNQRADKLFGRSLPERALKDYNGQTYWLSANLKSFFPQSNFPGWLNLAAGYGASGMFGGYSNKWEYQGTLFDRSDIYRQRQFYLAPDIDFTRIPTNSKLLKTLFFALNAFKLPAPALMMSKGKLRFYPLYF